MARAPRSGAQETAERAIRAGAMGYVMNEQAKSELLIAIRKVLQGEMYISYKLVMGVFQRTLHKGPGPVHEYKRRRTRAPLLQGLRAVSSRIFLPPPEASMPRLRQDPGL
jgi:DNA-binding NarL/FixJ family response regulator